ncbi:MAG TPA: hypothetical protein VFI47_31305 [Acidimicrobiales bacterium]|nr:hypothetical protein [Acidimicrobiales bacterium]
MDLRGAVDLARTTRGPVLATIPSKCRDLIERFANTDDGCEPGLDAIVDVVITGAHPTA